ncbi:hypothetical protein A3Q56_03957 [Intoshia linei]|uniref:SEC7 domain-containing protein n=1 Tax=Intoshia linei TaxID=1819745 RepID=A0A177B3Y6_9BILA|nr:hypothetical protein A3Q56_03957 [Intoshia linei]
MHFSVESHTAYNEIFNVSLLITRTIKSTQINGHSTLLRNLDVLMEKLSEKKSLMEMEPLEICIPLLEIIKAENSSLTIVAKCLESLHIFLQFDIFSIRNNNMSHQIQETISEIAGSVSSIKFVGSDPDKDEIIVFKIITIFNDLVTLPYLSQMLSNKSIVQIIKLSLSILCEARISSILKEVLVDYCKNIVSHLFQCDIIENLIVAYENNNKTTEKNDSNENLIEKPKKADKNDMTCRYEIMKYLIILIYPCEKTNEKMKIYLGFEMLNIIIEKSLESLIKYQPIKQLISTDLCRNFYLYLSLQNYFKYTSKVLRLVFYMFDLMRRDLKFQLELILDKMLIPLYTSGMVPQNGTSNLSISQISVEIERRTCIMHALKRFMKLPHFIESVYINYDCVNEHVNFLPLINDIIRTKQISSSKSNTSAKLSVLFRNSTLLDFIQTLLISLTFSYNVSDDISTLNLNTGDLDRDEENVTGLEYQKALSDDNYPFCERYAIDTYPASLVLKKHYEQSAHLFNTTSPSKSLNYHIAHCGYNDIEQQFKSFARFLKYNDSVDIKKIGEFLAIREYQPILKEYICTFNCVSKRIDQSLREFLSSFRLAGEAPQIANVLETFASYWHESNGLPFNTPDAAFTLAYAIVILNVDQHNETAKKQNVPMTEKAFIDNLNGVNGTENFDREMLSQIYNDVRNYEIIVPEERDGLVKLNYIWNKKLNCHLSNKVPFYDLVHTQKCQNNMPTGKIFNVLYKSIIDFLTDQIRGVSNNDIDSKVFKKCMLSIFECVNIASTYNAVSITNDVVLKVCHLCQLYNDRFDYTSNHDELIKSIATNANQLSIIKAIFTFSRQHGNALKESWKGVLSLFNLLFRWNMLSEVLVEVEDFTSKGGRLLLEAQKSLKLSKNESSVLSSFYNYFNIGLESKNENIEQRRVLQSCIDECTPEQLILDSKFLYPESAVHLVVSLAKIIKILYGSMIQKDESVLVFYFELLVMVLLQNRDRFSLLWRHVGNFFYFLVDKLDGKSKFVERVVVDILRISIKLIRRDDYAHIISKNINILFQPRFIGSMVLNYNIVFGLHEIIKIGGDTFKQSENWVYIFRILILSGLGYYVDEELELCYGAKFNKFDDLDTTGTSNTKSENFENNVIIPEIEKFELDKNNEYDMLNCPPSPNGNSDFSSFSDRRNDDFTDLEPCRVRKISENWTLVSTKDPDISTTSLLTNLPENDNSPMEIVYNEKIMSKLVEIYTFMVRENYMGSSNIFYLTKALIVNTRALFYFKKLYKLRKERSLSNPPTPHSEKKSKKHKHKITPIENKEQGPESLYIQFLELIHSLHTRAAMIYHSSLVGEQQTLKLQINDDNTDKSDQASNLTSFEVDSSDYYSNLWENCWKPLMISMTLFCTDQNRNARGLAFTFLQRALLQQDLQALPKDMWVNCFSQIIFPLIHKCCFHFPIESFMEDASIEETHLRATQLMCKVYLQHLYAFTLHDVNYSIWFELLNIILNYISFNKSELLVEALPELLKNMLLVMRNSNLFNDEEVWVKTCHKIDNVLPNFINNLNSVNTKSNDIFSDSPSDEESHLSTCNVTASQNQISDCSVLLNPEIIESVMSVVTQNTPETQE